MVWVRSPVYFYKRGDTFYFSRTVPSDLRHREYVGSEPFELTDKDGFSFAIICDGKFYVRLETTDTAEMQKVDQPSQFFYHPRSHFNPRGYNVIAEEIYKFMSD